MERLTCTVLYGLQVIFKVKEQLSFQLMHYDVSAGAYLQLDDPRPLELSCLTMLLPADVAEQASTHSLSSAYPWPCNVCALPCDAMVEGVRLLVACRLSTLSRRGAA
jgi:hypothetical protein